MDELKEQLKGRGLRPATLTNYISSFNCLSRLCRNEDWQGGDFLLDHETVFKKLQETYPLSTIKTKIIAALVAMQPTKQGIISPKYEETVPIYINYLNELKKTLNEQSIKQEKTKKEEDKWVSMKELIKIQKSYAFKLRKLGITTR